VKQTKIEEFNLVEEEFIQADKAVDPEIYLSSCLNAFKALEPHSIKEMTKIFEEYKISSEKFSAKPYEVMKDENLVIKIGPKFYEQ